LNDPISKSEWRRRALILEQVNNSIGAAAVQMEQDIRNVIAVLDSPVRLFRPGRVSLIRNIVDKYRVLKIMEGANAGADQKPQAQEQVPLGVGATH
jgi:hypothetical protein